MTETQIVPFKKLTREALKEHRRRQVEWGFTFPLTATSLGLEEIEKAQVRRLSLMDNAAIDSLSQTAQDTIWRGVEALRAARKARERDGLQDGEEYETFADMRKSNDRVQPAADAYCIASFVDPVLVEHERDIPYLQSQVPEDVRVWWVNDIHEDDRIAFFSACNDPASPAAKRLKLFRPTAGTIEASGSVVQEVGARSIDPPTRTVERPERVIEATPTPFRNLEDDGRGV